MISAETHKNTVQKTVQGFPEYIGGSFTASWLNLQRNKSVSFLFSCGFFFPSNDLTSRDCTATSFQFNQPHGCGCKMQMTQLAIGEQMILLRNKWPQSIVSVAILSKNGLHFGKMPKNSTIIANVCILVQMYLFEGLTKMTPKPTKKKKNSVGRALLRVNKIPPPTPVSPIDTRFGGYVNFNRTPKSLKESLMK